MENLVGKTIGGCRIEAKIGQGGMGVVYRAHHEGLDIPVAVKVLTNLSEIPDAQERFLREARIAARLRHPSIVGVLNVGCEEGIHFIVMEYVEGTTLQQRMTRRGKMSPREALPVAVAVLEALQVAHENGIVHRDIKPENILIEKGGAVKLADLGLARIGGVSNLTRPDTVLGSPYYVAPEQAENPSAADSRADIYSLGCTLYHMITGNIPFPGATVIEVVMNHINKPVPKMTTAVKGIPPAFSDTVARMMEKNPAHRFRTPREAMTALQASLTGGEPLHHHHRGDGFRRRLMAGIGAAGLIAVLLLVIVLVASGKHERVTVQASETNATAEPSSSPVPEIPSDTVIPLPGHQSPVAAPETASTRRKSSLPGVEKRVKALPAPPPPAVSTSRTVRNASVDPVLSAVKIGDTETLERLLREGRSPNESHGTGTTPLHEAVRRGLSSETALLLRYGADANARDARGDTPLHYALREGATYMAEKLLEGGADPNLPDHQGKTGLTIARSVDSQLETMVRRYGGGR